MKDILKLFVYISAVKHGERPPGPRGGGGQVRWGGRAVVDDDRRRLVDAQAARIHLTDTRTDGHQTDALSLVQSTWTELTRAFQYEQRAFTANELQFIQTGVRELQRKRSFWNTVRYTCVHSSTSVHLSSCALNEPLRSALFHSRVPVSGTETSLSLWLRTARVELFIGPVTLRHVQLWTISTTSESISIYVQAM